MSNKRSYNPSMAKWAMDEVNYTNIRGFFEEFTSSEHHRPGTEESKRFASYVRESWMNFGLQKVEIEEVDVARLPEATSKRKEIAIRDEFGRLVDRIPLTAENSAEVWFCHAVQSCISLTCVQCVACFRFLTRPVP